MMLLIIVAKPLFAQDKDNILRIIAYNVENLFHPEQDSLHQDTDFTPNGNRHWTYTKYHNKLEHIAQVINNIGQFEGVDIVGLCEIENKQCIIDLCHKMKRFSYNYIHFDSPDLRGIDVALLYRPTFHPINAYPIRINLGEKYYTRDILYVSGLYAMDNNSSLPYSLRKRKNNSSIDTIHIFLCHLPSQSGGTAASEWKREKAITTLQHHVDSILNLTQKAKIIVMGDMNSLPKNNIQPLQNAMLSWRNKPFGTYKYKGKWETLDQFYLTNNLINKTSIHIYQPDYILEEDKRYLDRKPKRTYIGYRYQNGYSDHLPIVLDVLK